MSFQQIVDALALQATSHRIPKSVCAAFFGVCSQPQNVQMLNVVHSVERRSQGSPNIGVGVWRIILHPH